MAGRRPKATALKKVLGNPGKRKLPENEFTPVGDAQKPAWLKGEASKLWDKYAPGLTNVGLLTWADADMFAAWCALMANFARNPEAAKASDISQMRALAESWGLTASSRARLAMGEIPTPARTDGDSDTSGTKKGQRRKLTPAEEFFEAPGSDKGVLQ